MPARARRCGGRRVMSSPRQTNAAAADLRVAHDGENQRGFADAVAAEHREAAAFRQLEAIRRRARRRRHSRRGRRRAQAAARSWSALAGVCRVPCRDRPRALADRRRSRPACPRPEPGRRPCTMMRAAKRNTSSMSCSMNSTVMSRDRPAMAANNSSLSSRGTPAAGSSSSNTFGRVASASAISSRRCWP